jgi:hypothetical protein
VPLRLFLREVEPLILDADLDPLDPLDALDDFFAVLLFIEHLLRLLLASTGFV